MSAVAGMDQWLRRCRDAHVKEVADGKHDPGCEWGERVVDGHPVMQMMCHCPKRRRLAAGHAEPPGPLLPPGMPICPRCFDEVWHDGDSFRCDECHVTWSSTDDTDRGEFTDGYGDLGVAGPVDDASLDRAIAEGRLLPGDVEAIRESRVLLSKRAERREAARLEPGQRGPAADVVIVDETHVWERRDPAQVRIDDIAADRTEAAQERYDRALGYVEDERGASC